MTGGQASLELASVPAHTAGLGSAARVHGVRPVLRVLRADPQELVEHAACLESIETATGGDCLWKQLEPDLASA